MKKKISLMLFLGATTFLFGQQTLNGYAPAFIGEKVTLYAYQDYLTMNRIVMGEGVVSEKDSMFHINYKTNSTIKGIVEIDHTEGSLYLTPGKDYTVYFSPSLEIVGSANAETNLYFSDLDTLDVNYLILQYHEWFDVFVTYHAKDIRAGGFLACLDTFKTYATAAYEKIDNPYFITYVRYDLAEMEQTSGGNRRSEKRLETYLTYIDPFPVYYENDRYMKFIRAFYDKEFREYLPVTEELIWNAINESSPTLLMQALKSDIFLAKPELRELVMIDKLGKAFYREVEFQPNILTILDSVSAHSTSPSNAAMARNVMNYITNLESGYPAPPLMIKREGDHAVTWSTYQGKFVYLNFFATWNELALNDMEIISKLVAQYDEDIAFVSVCTDADSTSFNAFMKAHPNYTWDIFYIGESNQMSNSFKVTTVPAYFLVDQDGFIFSAPALAPSPNGKYESIDKTLFEIKKALHPIETPRVGEK